MLLSVCMIVRDKAQFISRTINSAKKVADEIILIDLASLDNTRPIAENLGVKVYQLHREIDISESRNFAKRKAMGKWILFLEGNEELFDDYGQLRALLQDAQNDGFYLPIIDFNIAEKCRCLKKEQENQSSFPKLSLRLYRNKSIYRYNSYKYESLTNSVLKSNGEVSFKILHLPIIRRHISILPKEIKPLSLFKFQFIKELSGNDQTFKYLKYAIKKFWQGEYGLAMKKLVETYHCAGLRDRAIILQNQILILLENKQYQRAEEKIQLGLREYTDNKMFVFWQGYIEYIKGNYPVAINYFKRIGKDNNLKKNIQKNVFLLLGLSYLADKNKKNAELYLEKAFNYDKGNKLLINSLLETKGFDSEKIFSFFKLNNPANKKIFFILIQALFFRKKYQVLEDIIDKQVIVKKDDNFLIFWQGLIYLKQGNYSSALRKLKKIPPNFIYYQDVLCLQWILNIVMPGRTESKSIVNQIKLLGDKLNWNIIKSFNEIYFYQQDVIFKFDNLVAKFKFYQRTLYFLDYLIEFSSISSIIIMMEIVDNLHLKRSSSDIGLLFYIHGYWEQAYEFLKIGIEQGEVLPEVGIMAEICKNIGYHDEEKVWQERSKFLDLYNEIEVDCRKYDFFVE